MEDPVGQIVSEVIKPLFLGSAQESKGTVSAYFTPNCAVHHPLYKLESGVNSIEAASRIFATRAEAFSSSDLTTQSVALDETNNRLCCEISRKISIRFLPFTGIILRTIVLVQLVAGGNGRYYISRWEELMQSDDLATLMFLPGIRFVINSLRKVASVATSVVSMNPLFKKPEGAVGYVSSSGTNSPN